MSDRYRLIQGDCLEVLPTLEANSADAIICDPPYGLSFMGKDWDHGVPGVPFWEAALRVAKPGAMLLAFGGTRTHHRLMCAIEDAGWEIRDCLMWLYGSGFPKSMDIGKAIDKAAGAEREVIGLRKHRNHIERGDSNIDEQSMKMVNGYTKTVDRPREVTAPATDAARQWDGWGTALKPAWEPIIMARKPFEGTVAQNVLAHGVAGINVDKCRIGNEQRTQLEAGFIRRGRTDEEVFSTGYGRPKEQFVTAQGRWPANVLLDEESARLLDEMSGERPSGAWNGHRNTPKTHSIYGAYASADEVGKPASTGGASRFFYVAKASRRDRNEGLEGMPERANPNQWRLGAEEGNPRKPRTCTGVEPVRNHHPTVKPTQLMRYLCRLVTPPGGTVLDPFMGSGSTGKAAALEGFDFVGIELDPEYMEIARRRIEQAQMPLLEGV